MKRIHYLFASTANVAGDTVGKGHCRDDLCCDFEPCSHFFEHFSAQNQKTIKIYKQRQITEDKNIFYF